MTIKHSTSCVIATNINGGLQGVTVFVGGELANKGAQIWHLSQLLGGQNMASELFYNKVDKAQSKQGEIDLACSAIMPSDSRLIKAITTINATTSWMYTISEHSLDVFKVYVPAVQETVPFDGGFAHRQFGSEVLIAKVSWDEKEPNWALLERNAAAMVNSYKALIMEAERKIKALDNLGFISLSNDAVLKEKIARLIFNEAKRQVDVRWKETQELNMLLKEKDAEAKFILE